MVLRHHQEHAVKHISNRTIDGLMLFHPDHPRIRRIIAGVLCWAAVRHRVLIYGYSFLSNHFHLLAGFPRRNMGRFMADLTREIVRRVNCVRDRSGSAFAESYCAIEVRLEPPDIDPEEAYERIASGQIEGETFLDVLTYIHINPTRHGLVDRPAEWAGLSSLHHHLDDSHERARQILGPRRGAHYTDRWGRRIEALGAHRLGGQFLDGRRRASLGRSCSDEEACRRATQVFELELSKPPMWRHLSWERIDAMLRRRAIWASVEAREGRLCADRTVGTPELVAERDWRERHMRRRPRSRRRIPRVHASDAEHAGRVCAWIARRERQHRRASRRYRYERVPLEEAGFPRGTVPPGYIDPIEVILGEFTAPDDPYYRPRHGRRCDEEVPDAA